MNCIFNFSGIYDFQTNLGRRICANNRESIYDLSSMTGVNGYCSEDAGEYLRRLISDIGPDGAHFLDNGNYHYLSSFFLKNIKEPFDLIVFDHHTDMQPPGLIPCLSCGSWVLDSIEEGKTGMNLLRQVILIGPPEAPDHEGTVCIGEGGEDLMERTGDKNVPVYISVDKDILSKEEVILNWDQGSMTCDMLCGTLEKLFNAFRVIGMDICGEPVYNINSGTDVSRSESINLKLFELFEKHI